MIVGAGGAPAICIRLAAPVVDKTGRGAPRATEALAQAGNAFPVQKPHGEVGIGLTNVAGVAVMLQHPSSLMAIHQLMRCLHLRSCKCAEDFWQNMSRSLLCDCHPAPDMPDMGRHTPSAESETP